MARRSNAARRDASAARRREGIHSQPLSRVGAPSLAPPCAAASPSARRSRFARAPPRSPPPPGTGRTACHLRPRPAPPAPRRGAGGAPSSREVKGTSRRADEPACATPGHAAGGIPGPDPPRIMAPVSLTGLARGLDMIIDRETFTELAVHLKLASDAILKTARHLAVLSNGDSSNEEQWAGTLDSLMAMNTEITVMEKILRALMEANREEESPSLMVPDKKSEPLPS